MLVVVLSMLLIVIVGVFVVAYVAFPARGRAIPCAPWMGTALERAAVRVGLDERNEPERSLK